MPNGWALLLDREAAKSQTPGAFQIRLRSAKLRHSQAAIEDVDYRTPATARTRRCFQQLTAGQMDRRAPQFARNGGRCGIGKIVVSLRTRPEGMSGRLHGGLTLRVPAVVRPIWKLAHG